MNEKLDKTQENEALTDEALEEVSGGINREYIDTKKVKAWCPYCKAIELVYDKGDATIRVMAHRMISIPVHQYACIKDVRANMYTGRAHIFYVDEADGQKSYFDEAHKQIK